MSFFFFSVNGAECALTLRSAGRSSVLQGNMVTVEHAVLIHTHSQKKIYTRTHTHKRQAL